MGVSLIKGTAHLKLADPDGDSMRSRRVAASHWRVIH